MSEDIAHGNSERKSLPLGQNVGLQSREAKQRRPLRRLTSQGGYTAREMTAPKLLVHVFSNTAPRRLRGWTKTPVPSSDPQVLLYRPIRKGPHAKCQKGVIFFRLD